MSYRDEEVCPECERPGHTFRSCPKRDDDPGYDAEGEEA